jgi:membrane protein DedA with SNARE-associated domain
MFDWLTEQVSAGPITYLVVAFAAGGDVLFPLIPSETIVITASVLAAQGDLRIWLIVPAVAVGAFIGDNISYLLGRVVGDPAARRLFQGEKAGDRLQWAERAMQRRGSLLVVVGRFIPGGRTASTFAAGTLEMAYRKFVVADAAAALAWALYASMLGYLGGQTFKHSLWKPIVGSLVVAGLVTLGIEGWRRVQRSRGRDILGDEDSG